MSEPDFFDQHESPDIAIIGMAGRFPGANDLDAFWRNLRDGVESITFFSDQDLAPFDLDPGLLRDPNFVKAGAFLEQIEYFDAAFFGYSPKEAEMIDPQQRIFLEQAWAALERAGYHGEAYQGAIGVYAGASMNSYLLVNLIGHAEVAQALARRQVNKQMEISVENAPDFLTTRVSYKLNLRGPSHLVQCACSTSLAAVHIACQGLLNEECDMALAGGVSININQQTGYYYHEGGIASPDGHCRAFDAAAQGTVLGSGVGVVVLKRLADALDDGDTIYAIIRGSAINNDGSLKVGFTAPSVDGQAKVIAEALANAGVGADTISYIEAHGTGTPLGDPIEIKALTKAFRATTERAGFCALGSLKTNIGHLDITAGIAGLIKTVLALQHRQIPPSLHYETPNPEIDFAASPFYVNTSLAEWKTNGAPRRAGVSSFGIGGTNVHVILEEAPPRMEDGGWRMEDGGWASALSGQSSMVGGRSSAWQLLPISAKTEAALEQATSNLAAFLARTPAPPLPDIAFTLQRGRAPFPHRRLLLARDHHDALQALTDPTAARILAAHAAGPPRAVAFLLPGQGGLTAPIDPALYHAEPAFQQALDRCADLLAPALGCDIRALLLADEERMEDGGWRMEARETAILHPPSSILNQTQYAQPTLFALCYALAQLYRSWGLQPAALLGHSLGELVAATIAGVFELEDALHLVALRGRLMQAAPPGAMLAVPLDEATARARLSAALDLAAVNGPRQCVLAGRAEAVFGLEGELASEGLRTHRLPTERAFHSHLLDGVVAPFVAEVARVRLKPPTLPVLSNVSGTWLTAAEACDASYWGRQLRQTVRFGDGLAALRARGELVLLELGSGRALSGLAQQAGLTAVPTLAEDAELDTAGQAQRALGALWLAGVAVDWDALHSGERRRRVALPTYPFQRQRFWIAPTPRAEERTARQAATGKTPDIADWFYLPSWKRTMPPRPCAPEDLAGQAGDWLVFVDARGVGAELLARLARAGRRAAAVLAGERFSRDAPDRYTIDPRRPGDYDALLDDLAASGIVPRVIVHGWSISAAPPRSGRALFQECQERGYQSLLFLAQALARKNNDGDLRIIALSSDMQRVYGEAAGCPEKLTLLGPCKVIPLEYLNITCQNVDISMPTVGSALVDRLVDQLLAEIVTSSTDLVVAYRSGERLVQTFERTRLERDARPVRSLRQGGVYLITGGLGRVGLLLAEELARTARAKLALLTRAALPEPATWDEWLAAHDPQHPLSRTIGRLRGLEQQGAEVLLISADVADERQMCAALRRIDERFGALHGIIHAAGSMTARSGLLPIAQLGPTESEAQFQAKVYGLYVLEELLRDRALDFCLLCSSNAAILGGLGFGAYAAANLFMDAFAAACTGAGRTPWISANWDTWLTAETTPSAADTYAMTADESVEAFRRVVTQATVSQVVVSPGDLPARLQVWIRHEFAGAAHPASAPHRRPGLPTDYIAPESDLEQAIAHIWQETLGVEQVGLEDNFFELGGNSLIAIQAIARLKDELQIQIPVSRLYERLTIKALVELVAPDHQHPPAERDGEQFKEKENRALWRKQYQQSRRSRHRET